MRHTRVRTRHQSASHKERARLNRHTKQLEFDLDIARRDAAAARADEAAARADGAADRAKIASLRILKVTLPLARTHARTRARREAAPPPVHFVATSLSPSRTRGGARSLARSRARAVAARAVTAAAAAAAAAATDDTRDDGRGDDPPPAPPSGTGACQRPPPPQKHHRAAPSSSHFCPLSRPLSRRARGRVSGTPIIRPSVRMTAHCARAAHNPPPPPARARERARPRPPSGDIATRRHDDANLGWQAAAAVPRLTEPSNPNPNPNDARIERMTREPARATSPNPPPHARERARPTPPPRPSPRRRDPHATQHTTRPRAVTSPPAAPPRRIAPTTHRRSSGYVCVLFCGPAGFGYAFSFDFLRARSRDVAKGAFAAEWWPKNREIRKRGVVSCQTERTGPFPNAHDRVSNITPKAEFQELGELHTTARLEMSLLLLRRPRRLRRCDARRARTD